MVIFQLLFLTAIIIFMIWKITAYLFYRHFTAKQDRRSYAPMKWSMVRKLYIINPKRFKYVYRDWHSESYEILSDDVRSLFYDNTPIMLSFFGYQMLRFNYILFLINKNRKRRNDAIEKVLTTAQLDIEVLKRQADKEQRESKSMLLKVLERMENENK